MTFGEMYGVGELHHVPQKVRTLPEALEDARHLLPPGRSTPLVVRRSDIAGGIGVLDELDFQSGFGHIPDVIRHQSLVFSAHGVVLPMAT